ncbi:MAG: polyprenyl synthetase family protein [Candidatus Obscuribacterales bacterium]|nr:polyprenyl synthetase family protein [Candidatus Obscuribacterales bacterium]
MQSTIVDLNQLLAPIKPEMQLVDTWLTSNLIDDNNFVSDLLSQVFKAGGKRLRPALTILASKASLKEGDEISRLHIILAVLTELIHTASLVHDDVIDQASLRRGESTVNKKWNDKLAVLIGDLLFAQASICLARLMNPQIVGIYGQVLGDLCAGEIKQMRQQFSTSVDWDTYIQKSVNKTASLFAAGCQSSAILNRRDEDVVASLKSYGVNLGVCFQIVDDLLDVTGNTDQLGKAAGSDLANGVVTAPALFVLEQNDANANRLKELINTRAVSQPDGLAEALSIINQAGGVEKTVQLATKYAQAAKQNLDCLSPSTYKDSLAAIADYLLVRTN